MNLLKKLYSRRILSVLDFDAETVVALCVEKEDSGAWRVLGGGEARSRGVGAEGITFLGDAVESVAEAVDKAQRSAGTRIGTLYFNLDDALLQGVRSCGSKILAGEGEIGLQSVSEARHIARRLVGDFHRCVVYSRDTGYLIDQKDTVDDPVGVCGERLDVSVYFLLARAELCDAWKNVMARAGLGKAVPVISAWSTAYGVLPKSDRRRRRVIADLGEDLTTSFVFENGGILDLRVRATAAGPSEAVQNLVTDVKDLLTARGGAEQILVTGDRASEEGVLRRLGENFSIPSLVASPTGIPKLDQPKFSSLAGLVGVAEELERRAPLLRNEKGLLGGIREKAREFIQEYF